MSRVPDELTSSLQNLDAERAMLGAVLLRPSLVADAIGIVDEADFYRQAHTLIWSAIVRLTQHRVSIDLVTLCEDLQRVGDLDRVGGPAYITRLIDNVPRSSHISDYARIVAELARRRRIRDAMKAALTRIESDEDSETVIADVQSMLRPSFSERSDVATSEKAISAFADWLERQQSPDAVSYSVTTGLTEIDTRYGGMQPGLNVLAARPSHGKTALALNIADHLSLNRSEVGAFVSSEMSLHMITGRWIALRSGVSGFDVIRGMVDPDRIGHAMVQCAGAPLHFMTGRRTPSMIRAFVLQMDPKPRFIIVDYIQILRPDPQFARQERHLQIKSICEALKDIAYELDVPVLALAQLNRAAEDRTEPELRDLREAGDIENEADSAWLLHRPDDSAIAQLHIAKQRNGPKGKISLRYDKPAMRFTDSIY